MKTTDHLIPSRAAKRARFDSDTIYPILDEALYCTISYSLNNRPYSIPTAFVRHEDKIYIHGSVGSHFIREIEKSIPVCITVTLMDALVIAKCAFSHSVNYRSVVIFSQAEKLEDPEDKVRSFEWLTDKMVPGSWHYLRPMKESEAQKTTALAFNLDESSAKIREQMPNNVPEDLELPIWSGIIPFRTERLYPVADESSGQIPLPPHLQ